MSQLPDTCPTTSQPSQCTQPSQASQKPALPWGYLFPYKPKLRWMECFNEEYLIGRAPKCNLVLGDEIDPKVRCQFSKEHFRLRRAPLNPTSNHKVVYLDDLSFNGTFVNGKKIGRKNSVVLRNGDKISLALSSYEAFIYVDKDSDVEVRCYPAAVLQKYGIAHRLGRGAYGEVRLVFDKSTGQGLAMKVIQKNKFLQSMNAPAFLPTQINREINILKKLCHKFVIKFHNVLDFEDAVFLVMELVHGGELFNRVQSQALKENEAKYYFYQLALAIRYLHRQGIIHRDIKLENILLTADPDPIMKLADFGLSNFVDPESMLKTYCGTPMYIAPEVLASEGRQGSYDTQADVWSMGIVLYMCLSGITPFISNDPKLPLKNQILSGYYSFPRSHWKYISHTAKDLVKRMLVVNPARRITITKIFEHPWLKHDINMRQRVDRLLRDSELTGKENVIHEEDEDEMDDLPRAKRPKIVEYDTSSLSSVS